MKSIMCYLVGLLLLIGMVFGSFEIALAQDPGYGLGRTAGAAGLNTQGDLPTLIGNIIGTALSMIGVLFFILMIYGGFLWMTARGNEEHTKKAKETIIAATIGIIIILSAYAITRFVFQAAVQGGAEFCPSTGGDAACAGLQDRSPCQMTNGGFGGCVLQGSPTNACLCMPNI